MNYVPTFPFRVSKTIMQHRHSNQNAKFPATGYTSMRMGPANEKWGVRLRQILHVHYMYVCAHRVIPEEGYQNRSYRNIDMQRALLTETGGATRSKNEK